MNFEHFKSLLNEISQIESLSLTVVNFVSQVIVLDLEEVHNGKNLSIVRH